MSRIYYLAIIGVLLIALAVGWSIWRVQHDEYGENDFQLIHPYQQGKIKPTFDVVRTGTLGEMVIAGRAQPQTDIHILASGTEIGHVVSDNRGEWVFLLEHQLPPASYELKLRMLSASGSVVESESPVIMIVPDNANDKSTLLAIKIYPNGTFDLLHPIDDTSNLTISAIRYDIHKRLAITGKTPAGSGAWLQIYSDNQPIGRTKTKTGHWHVIAKVPMPHVNHAIRADLIDSSSNVIDSIEVNLSLEDTSQGDSVTSVQNGRGFWKIIRKINGKDTEYMTIYRK